jgi:hypothetical protein
MTAPKHNVPIKVTSSTKEIYASRFINLEYALSQITIKGTYLEFGVYNGTSINFISNILKDKLIHGFDSFEGIEETYRGLPPGSFSSLEWKDVPKFNQNVMIHKGRFQDILPPFKKEKIAFIHIDCDTYSATECVLTNLNSYIVPGTIIVFDELINYPLCEHNEYRAFHEFLENFNRDYEVISYVPHDLQVAIRITK